GVTGSASASVFNAGDATTSIISSLVAHSGGSGAGWGSLVGIDLGNNIDADPQFVAGVEFSAPSSKGGNAGRAAHTGGFESDPDFDLRLREGSPAIDAGSNTLALGIDTDLNGGVRLIGDIEIGRASCRERATFTVDAVEFSKRCIT